MVKNLVPCMVQEKMVGKAKFSPIFNMAVSIETLLIYGIIWAQNVSKLAYFDHYLDNDAK